MATLSTSALSGEAIAESRGLIGVRLRRRQHSSSATRQSITRWVKATGDRNPLWLDDGYARSTALGGIVAPPCWLYSVDDSVVDPKLPGCHAIYAGVDFEFFRRVRLGDELSVEARLLDVQQKQGRFCGPMALQVGEVSYTDKEGGLLAKAVSKVLRTPRAPALERGKYARWQKHRYSEDELRQIEADYDAEVVRGSTPRYWEDVHEGDYLQPVVRGPLTSEDMVQFISSTRPVMGFGEFLRYRKRHPAGAFSDPLSGIWESWDASMLNDDAARMFGFPFAHDAGIDRICWIGSLLTNWMSDLGFLRRLSVDLLLPNILGDTTRCKGKVLKKLNSDAGHVVEVEVWCENQRPAGTTSSQRQRTASGRAVVQLPSRDAGEGS